MSTSPKILPSALPSTSPSLTSLPLPSLAALAGPITSPTADNATEIELRDRTGRRTSVFASGVDAGLRGSARDVSMARTDASGDHAEYLDGGFGWVIVACTFVISFHFLGILYAWGVIQEKLLHDQLSSNQLLSLIGGLDAFFTAAACLPTSILIRRFGIRNTTLSGVLLLGVNFILCGFATKSFGGLLFLQGIVVGCANGVCFMCVYPLATQFFMRKRGLASGITSCGGGIGGAVWSIAVQKMIAGVGLEWSYRILGLSCLACGIPAALVLRPGVQARPAAPLSGMTPVAEPSIFRSTLYIRMLLACALVSWPFFIPPFFLPQYAVSIGLTSAQGALFSALYNIASGIGRISFGFLADMVTGNLTAWIVALLSILLSSVFVWPYSSNFAAVAGFAIWCGLGSGGFFALQSSIVAQLVGHHRVNQAIGYVELVQSFGGLIGPVTAGLLLDRFGGANAGADPYKPGMYLVGGSTALAALLALSVRGSFNRKFFVKA